MFESRKSLFRFCCQDKILAETKAKSRVYRIVNPSVSIIGINLGLHCRLWHLQSCGSVLL